MKQLKNQYLKWLGHIWANYFWFLLAGIIWTVIAWFMKPSLAQWIGFILLIIEIMLWIFRKLTQLQIHFDILDFIRHQYNPILWHPFKSSLIIFKHKHRAMSAIGIGLLKIWYTFLWALPSFITLTLCSLSNTIKQLWIIPALLMVIPIIKFCYTYVMAQYIYYDGDRADQMVTVMNSVKLSKLLMVGHKFQFFIIQATIAAPVIVGSLIVGALTYLATCITSATWLYTESITGITFLIVMLACAPYLKLLELHFYQYLIQQRVQQHSKLYSQIMKKV